MSKIEKKGSKGLLKCAVAGVSLMLCMSMFPINAVNDLVSALEDSSVAEDQTAITLNASKTSNTVKKGDYFYIPKAKFDGQEIAVENVKVTVKGSSTAEDILEVTGIDDSADFCGMFLANKVTTYVISYTATKDGKTYTYDYEVECEVSEASFEFADNSQNIIPTIYDVALLQEKNMINAEGAGPDIVLPMPNVNDENGDKVGDVSFSTVKTGKGNEVVVQLSNATSDIKIASRETGSEGEKEFYISGAELTKRNESGDLVAVGIYKIVYTYYENGVFVTQTTKQFEVKDEYYKTTDDEAGYKLTASFDAAQPTSAVTGVELELPSVSGKSSNTTETYDIPVYYTIAVSHKIEGNWVDKTAECLDKENQRLFTPYADGDYKIVYTVKDFYGNTVDVANTQFQISGVKDTKAPTVMAYDANADYSKETVDGEVHFVDAKTKMKSRTVNRNMIVYAIGAEDNVEGFQSLTRTIRDAAGSSRIEITEYNDKNLVFNVSRQPGNPSVTSAYVQLVNDNYALSLEMKKDSVDTSNESQIKAWLIEHNYLIVTNSYKTNPITNAAFELKDEEGQPIVTDSNDSQFDMEAIKNALAKEGFAYVNCDDKALQFSQQQYRIVYKAVDMAGNDTTVTYQMYITVQDDYVDELKPSVTFSTSLQSTYLPNDKFEFSAPVASDTTDENPTLVFGYRYLDSGKNAIKNENTSTISFTVNDRSKVDKNVWYGNGAGEKSSDGWFILEQESEDQTFSVDLSEKLQGAAYVEIFAYAMDDYGNMGFFSKVIEIAAQNDTSPIDLYAVSGYEGEESDYKANSEIQLPTLTYTDDLVEYVTAQVYVYYFAEEKVDDETIITRKTLQSSNMETSFDSARKIYTVDAGSFMASRAGNYQVVVIAKDAGNNSIATFFDYYIGSVDYVSDPVIDNITSETIELDIDEKYYLATPTLSITENGTYGYWGLSDDQDDSNSALYYTTKITAAENNTYELTKYHFIPKSNGIYTLQYEVQLIQYKQDLLSEVPTDGKIMIEDDLIVYYDGGTAEENKYYVYIDGVDEASGQPKVVASKSLLDSTTDITTLPEGIKGIVLTSLPQTISVGVISSPVITVDEDAFVASQIITENGVSKIAIPNVTASVKGAGQLSEKNSKIEISVTRGSGTTTLATIYADKYTETNSDSVKYDAAKKTLYLTLSYDGTYSIKYTAQAANYNGEAVSDPSSKTFTLEYGDVVTPTITVEDGFLNKDAEDYGIGDELRLDINKLTLWDNKTDSSKLEESLEITVVNKDTDEELENKGEGTNYAYDFEVAGEYEITIKVKDDAGWTSEKTVVVKVATSGSNSTDVYKTVGIVFIVISVVVLAGVVTYFVVSKVKLDKKTNKNKKK